MDNLCTSLNLRMWNCVAHFAQTKIVFPVAFKFKSFTNVYTQKVNETKIFMHMYV